MVPKDESHGHGGSGLRMNCESNGGDRKADTASNGSEQHQWLSTKSINE